ncbi:MAG: sugar ABC transporter ATP-binding protein [Candidatus Hydrogenedentes bacterium]|nr:sugar ABC transporter ATP-binding protein [Candidatus Hydrogenedentota bacterium]
MTAAHGTTLLEVRDLSKQFPGVLALQHVNLTLATGEVLAVIGENGAGKSTLMKILAGVQTADSGAILLNGAPVNFARVKDALAAGIALIHQELNLADNLDVGANIFLGREPRRYGFIDKRAIHRAAQKLVDSIGLDVSTRTLVNRLPIGHQQMVEIAKALSVDARILIMDEPTSSLSQRETEHLYAVIRDLKARGVSIIYISHRLGEVKEIADRVTVLRDGKNAGELAKEEIHHDAMVRLMVGREMTRKRLRVQHGGAQPILEVRGLATPAYSKHTIDFTIAPGEIVGMAGLVGAGRTEILEALFGVTPALRGAICIGGHTLRPRTPREAIDAGLALVPEDRKQHGLVLEMAVRENISLPSVRRDQHRGFLNRRAESAICGGAIAQMNIKTPSPRQIAMLLSGGNQQKVVLGKWLAMKPKVLLLDEPTRGIDVGAKREVYGLMEELASQGVAILFVSSEMEEILTMSDRVLVVHEGALAGILPYNELTEETVMHLATGGHRQAAAV